MFNLHFGLLELLAQGDVPGGYLEMKLLKFIAIILIIGEYSLIVNTYPTRLEKSFLRNEGGCRDVSSGKRRGTRRCLDRDRKSLITLSLHLCF